MNTETKERCDRCYDCGCCESLDGWCDLVNNYGFEIDECKITEEEKWKHSSWNIHKDEDNINND